MGASLTKSGMSRGPRVVMMHRAWLAAALILSIAAAGCGSKKSEPAVDNEPKESEAPREAAKPKAAARAEGGSGSGGAKSSAKASAKAADKTDAKPQTTAADGHVQLRDRGCVAFEPHWTRIQPGQSVTWHSNLKKQVTIHVPPGVFDQTEFTVRPGGTVRTGPAKEPGDHALWSLPAACQAAPHGVQGAGPGVTVGGS